MSDETFGEEPTNIEAASPRDKLRADIRKELGELTHDIPIPSERFGGTLIARYRVLSALTDGKAIRQRVEMQFKEEEDRNYNGAIDQIVAACVGFYYRDPESGSLTLLDYDGAGAMGYDERLVEYLGLEGIHRARSIVEALFDHLDIAILAHARELSEWMLHPTSAVTLGEA